jgi:UPF0716 protein FxsA
VFARLLTLFIALPLVELTLMLMLAKYTDSWIIPVLFVIGTGLIGSWLARQQGYVVYRQIQRELSAGRMPTDAMIDGVMIFLAGILLMAPGVLSDIFGITLFIPPLRRFYRRQLIAWFHRTFKVNTVQMPGGERVAPSQVLDSYVVEKNSADDVSDQI